MYRLIRYAQPFEANAEDYRSRWSGHEQELNSFFGSSASEATRSIPVSVNEDKDNLQITAELPGVQRADVTVEIVDEVLSLRATRKLACAEGEKAF